MASKRQPKGPSPDDSGDGAQAPLRTLVLKPLLRSDALAKPSLSRDAQAVLEEAVSLARAIDLDVVLAQTVNLAHPTPAALLGSGLVEEFAARIKDEKIFLAVIDHTLSPVQQRNLERAWSCKVIDRTGLILEIFGARALTREGQLQVELAALTYQKSRLVRSWTHLERQRGGFGFMGGPGESQIEIDRRLIAGRIAKLKVELDQVRRTRGLQRQARQKAEHPTVALVGYTNAGKSTLFNLLTGSQVLAKDMLFATLDPNMRGVKLPSGQRIILSDTVGFISDLPTHLVEAFRATLEEVQLADVILHVRDITHPDTRSQKEAVETILAELGIEHDDERLVEVLNKVDLLDEDQRRNLSKYASRHSQDSRGALELEGLRRRARGGSVALSALTGEGMNTLIELLQEHVSRRTRVVEIDAALSNGALLAWLYGHGRILEKVDKRTKTHLKVALDEANLGRFISKFGKEVHVKS